MNEHQFVAMWDCQGLEYLEDITVAQQARVMAVLKNEPCTVHVPNLHHLRLRAQANPQRFYEIYVFNSSEGISKEDLLEAFESAPQGTADAVRRVGHCFFDGRNKEQPVIV